MVYWSLLHILTLFLDILTILRGKNSDKDLEIIILRQQVRILQRKQKSQPRNSTQEKMNFLIHDNDTKFSSFFDNVFTSEGMKVVHTPYRTPKANSYAERWVRSVREECLDQILVVNANPLRIILRDHTN